jgi:hypothetical protein
LDLWQFQCIHYGQVPEHDKSFPVSSISCYISNHIYFFSII